MNLTNKKINRIKAMQLLVGHIEHTGNRLHQYQFSELMEEHDIIYSDILSQLKPQTLIDLLTRQHYSQDDQY